MNLVQYSHRAWPIQSNFKFEIRTNIQEIDYPHYHDFHELSLIIKGSLNYMTSAMKETHCIGTLLFTREGEIHSKQANGPIKLLQVAFSGNTLLALQEYIDNAYDMSQLLIPSQSPTAFLYEKDIREIEKEFNDLCLNLHDNKIFKQYGLLIDLIAYFFTEKKRKKNIKYYWLANAMEQMADNRNFIEGTPALLRLTGRCHEYVTRCMREEYGITPSAFIADLRLNYAEGLLKHSEFDILTISAECGYNTPSHFYAQFKKKYKLTPLQYRKCYYVPSSHIESAFSHTVY